ncbi:hypothetical protein BKA66DRAFT_49109 [Pyrenochaeta sp. MPI-SDFR-AT-0127]|nr:hypothetical protein BKA66DRAFT_49109 [Pyrenochaeta sp. MPI-SDFR-AT-0127]
MRSRSALYRGSSKDAFHMSPAAAPSSGLLSPQSPFNLEARRNSDVSSLSLSSFTPYSSDYSMPPTPICGRSPFSADNFDPNALELNHVQTVHMLPIEYQMKASSFDESLGESWAFPSTANHMEQAIPIRASENIQFHGNYMQSPVVTYTGLEVPATAPTHPWCDSSTTDYTSFGSHMDDNGLSMNLTASLPPLWAPQVPSMQDMVNSTIAPGEAMLGGDYVHIDGDVDMDTDSYDNADVPLSPSPEEVVFKRESSPAWVKREPESSEDETGLRRSIYVSPTGGKSVRKEARMSNACKKKTKSKKPKSQFVMRWADGRYESRIDDVFQDKDMKWKWTDQQPRKKLYCKFPYEDDDDSIPDDHPDICGKPFQRPEHRQRHRKTHCSDKDFPCLLCEKSFNRNDNCWAHGFTHVHRPGKKEGRNTKFSLRQVISVISDPKHIEKLLNDWKKEVGTDYNPEEEEDDNPDFQDKVEKTGRMECVFIYDAEEAIRKICCLSP